MYGYLGFNWPYPFADIYAMGRNDFYEGLHKFAVEGSRSLVLHACRALYSGYRESTMEENTNLEGRVAVITGAGRGIGRATAIELARAGADVVLTARNQTQIEETAERVRQVGKRALVVSADVIDWHSMEQLVAQVRDAFGGVDIVVANAGVVEPVGDAWSVDPREWSHSVGINLKGAFYTFRGLVPLIQERMEGVVIFLSSGAAARIIPGWSAYCTAKAGIEHFVRVAAQELEERALRIRLHAVRPGIVDTAMQETARDIPSERFRLAGRFKGYHEKGWLRPPEEPAKLIRWLCTPMAADLHGQTVDLDDAAVRMRLASDLGLSVFKGRGE
jgi:NAD(P)-dependent dehydrogenase (short-subunit alcohol dehydrogenase family)